MTQGHGGGVTLLPCGAAGAATAHEFGGKMDKIKRWGFSATVVVPLFASASMGPENIWDIIEKF